MPNTHVDPPDIHLLAGIITRQMAITDIQPDHLHSLSLLAYRHKVFPLFHEAVQSTPESVPKTLLTRLSKVGLREKARAARIEDAISEIDTILDAAGIPAVWLKGAALGYMIYPAFWLRSMVDVDVMVPHAQRREARAALQAAGYIENVTRGVRPAVGHRLFDGLRAVLDDDVVESSSHHYVFLGRENKGVTIELHFHFLNMIELSPDLENWFWQHTHTIAGPQNRPLGVMTPEAMLLHLAAHNVLQHQQFDITSENAVHVTLRNMYDVYQLVTQHELDWPVLINQAVKQNWEPALAHTLTQADRYFPFPQTSEIYDVLMVLRERVWLPSPGQLARSNAVRRSILIWRILRHLPWRHKLAYLFHAFFPPRDTMREAYPDHPLWWAYLTRSVKIFGGVGRTFYHIVTGKGM